MKGEGVGATGLQNRNATGILQTDVSVVPDSITNLQKGKKKKPTVPGMINNWVV